MSKSKLDFLRGISDYFWHLTDQEGKLICPKHNCEHTGKNVYSIITDIKLYELTGEEEYFHRAKKRALRTAGKLTIDPDYGHWIFYPGRLGVRNNSNNVIDGGACADSLASFYLKFQDRLTQSEQEAILDSLYRHSETYLKDAVVGKEITNQRLWGGSGLASAYRIFRKDSWREALLNSIKKSLSEQNSDGSFPYHFHWQEYGIFIGISDVTNYYHSRCLAFIYYILDQIEEDISRFQDSLIKGADFLLAMYQPNGVKNINVEPKRWYWESNYEVASHPFDIYALWRAYQQTGEDLYLEYASKSLRCLLEHQLSDGSITSHKGSGSNYQCHVFWSGHFAWLARVIEHIPLDFKAKNRRFFRVFSDSGVVKFEDDAISVILRGNKTPMNVAWGAPIAGGSFLYAARKSDHWGNVFEHNEWREGIDNNFVIRVKGGILSRTKEFLAANSQDIIWRLYLAKTETLETKKLWFCSGYLWRHLVRHYLNSLKGVYTSHWSTSSQITKYEDGVRFELHPARRDGQELSKTTITREYHFHQDGIIVSEELKSKAEGIKCISYRKNKHIKETEIETNARVKRVGDTIKFFPSSDDTVIKLGYTI